MLVFAVWRRSAVDDAQSTSRSDGQKGPTGSLVAESSILPNCSFTTCGDFVWRVTRAVHTCAAAVSVLLKVRQRQTRFWLRTTVEITYSHGKGAVTQIEERQRRHAHGKELALRR